MGVREWVRRKEVDSEVVKRKEWQLFSGENLKSFNLPLGCVRDCVGLCQNPQLLLLKELESGRKKKMLETSMKAKGQKKCV